MDQTRQYLLEYFIDVQTQLVDRYVELERQGIWLSVTPRQMPFYARLLPKAARERMRKRLYERLCAQNERDITRNKALLKSQIESLKLCLKTGDDQAVAVWLDDIKDQVLHMNSRNHVLQTTPATWNIKWLIKMIDGKFTINFNSY